MYNGSKVFMDAHGTVTAEEWGSLPPRAAEVDCLVINLKITF